MVLFYFHAPSMFELHFAKFLRLASEGPLAQGDKYPTLVWSEDSIWGGHIGFN